MHGDATPRGAASPHFKHGILSKYLVGSRQARFVQAEADPELLSLREDVALAQMRKTELVERLATGESRETWGSLKHSMRALRRAEKAANKACEADDSEARDEALHERDQAIDAMEILIDEAQADDGAWRALDNQSLHKARLVGAEQRRLEGLQLMITQEQAQTRDAAIFAIITRHVRDRELLGRIGAEFRAIALVQSGGSAVPVRRG